MTDELPPRKFVEAPVKSFTGWESWSWYTFQNIMKEIDDTIPDANKELATVELTGENDGSQLAFSYKRLENDEEYEARCKRHMENIVATELRDRQTWEKLRKRFGP